MYHIFRIIIILFCMSLSYFILKKSMRKWKKRTIVLFLALAAILGEGIGLIPFENAFLSFETVEAAHRYKNITQSPVLVVEGDQGALVVAGSQHSQTLSTYYKAEKGWKLPFVADLKLVQTKSLGDTAYATVYQSRKTKEYFITVFDWETDTKVEDNKGTLFLSWANVVASTPDFTSYYAFVPFFEDGYALIVNGETFSFS